MKPPRLRLITSTRNSVIISWSSPPAFSSSGSSSSLLQRNRQSRSSLSSDDRKISRTSLGSADTAVRKSLRTPMESIEDVAEGLTEDVDVICADAKEFYTVQIKDHLFGWTLIYCGFKSQIEVTPLTPAEVFHFRIKATTMENEESDWSEVFTTATKDDVISATPLHRALDQSHMTSARKVLALRISTLEIPNKLGRTALQVASMKGDAPMCSMLLTCGADVNAREMGSLRTPLMMAASRGATEILHSLTERGASWTETNRFGQTALHFACMQSTLQPILAAIKSSPDINVKDKLGWSPLMYAVPNTTLDIIEKLIDNGADVNSCGDRKQTILMQAILSQPPEIVKRIIEKGAKIDAKNAHGHTARDFAQQKGKDYMVLLENLEMKDKGTGESKGELLSRMRKQSRQMSSAAPFVEGI